MIYKKITLYTIFSVVMLSCSNGNTGQSLPGNNELLTRAVQTKDFQTVDIQSESSLGVYTDEEKALYQQYLNAKRNTKSPVIFNGTSYELGPMPSVDLKKSIPDSTPYLDLKKNKILRDEKLGGGNFPSKRTKYPYNGFKGDFSTQQSTASANLHWGVKTSQITNPANNRWGIFATHSVNLNQTFPQENTLLYSPTTMPPNNTPVEVTTVYYRPTGQSANFTQMAFGIFDHTGQYGDPWIMYKQMNDLDFKNNYVGTYTDGDFYHVQIIKTNGTTHQFTVQLYNVQTGLWENQSGTDNSNQPITFPLTFNTVPTASLFNEGWNFHEPKYDDRCPAFNTIKTTSFQIWNGTDWNDNTLANGGYLYDPHPRTTCSNYVKTMVNNYYNWKVDVTP